MQHNTGPCVAACCAICASRSAIRLLLKHPDLLVVNEAVAVMDGATQGRLMNAILRYRAGQGVIWTLQRPSMAEHFERLVVMRSGRVIEQGDYQELKQPGSAFDELRAAE